MPVPVPVLHPDSEILCSADLHLAHNTAAIKFRGFDTVETHNRYLIDAWNDKVRDIDIVFLLGDACMGTLLDSVHLLGELAGQIILIPGNHDAVHPAHHHYGKERYAGIYDEYVTVGPLQKDFIDGSGDVWATMCHFPPYGDHTEDERYTEYRPEDHGQRFLHGHIHDLWSDLEDGRLVNVGVDVRGFQPVSITELQEQYS